MYISDEKAFASLFCIAFGGMFIDGSWSREGYRLLCAGCTLDLLERSSPRRNFIDVIKRLLIQHLPMAEMVK
jgi:hypothetical protein